jgi:NurA-like 5'-3' nuclease
MHQHILAITKSGVYFYYCWFAEVDTVANILVPCDMAIKWQNQYLKSITTLSAHALNGYPILNFYAEGLYTYKT